MKSFEAKLYIEDNLATIEFDVMMKGKYDEDYTPDWNFGIIENKWIPKKKKLSQTAPRTRLGLSVYNKDDMMMVGEIFQTDYKGDLHMIITSNSMDPKAGEATEEELIQEENLAKEISLQFLDLWLKGKQCIKYNYIYPHDEPTHLPLPQKHIRKEVPWTKKDVVGTTTFAPPEGYKIRSVRKVSADVASWDIYIKKPGETEFVYHKTYVEEIDTESDLEMRDVYQQIKHNKLSKTYPDGTPAKCVPTERDEDGTLKPKEN